MSEVANGEETMLRWLVTVAVGFPSGSRCPNSEGKPLVPSRCSPRRVRECLQLPTDHGAQSEIRLPGGAAPQGPAGQLL